MKQSLFNFIIMLAVIYLFVSLCVTNSRANRSLMNHKRYIELAHENDAAIVNIISNDVHNILGLITRICTNRLDKYEGIFLEQGKLQLSLEKRVSECENVWRETARIFAVRLKDHAELFNGYYALKVDGAVTSNRLDTIERAITGARP